jgi:hypothetical protein
LHITICNVQNLVRFSQLVHVVFLLMAVPVLFEGIEELVSEAFGHRLAGAGPAAPMIQRMASASRRDSRMSMGPDRWHHRRGAT